MQDVSFRICFTSYREKTILELFTIDTLAPAPDILGSLTEYYLSDLSADLS